MYRTVAARGGAAARGGVVAPGGAARPLLLVVRTFFVVMALYVAVRLWMGAAQRIDPMMADIGVAVATGVVIGLLCPEHWVWAAPWPIVYGFFQASLQVFGTSQYWDDSHDGITFLVLLIYASLALSGALIGRTAVRLTRRFFSWR